MAEFRRFFHLARLALALLYRKQGSQDLEGQEMNGTTYVCWRSANPGAGWTIYQVDPGGQKAAVACFKNYLEAARTLRVLRQGGQLN